MPSGDPDAPVNQHNETWRQYAKAMNEETKAWEQEMSGTPTQRDLGWEEGAIIVCQMVLNMFRRYPGPIAQDRVIRWCTSLVEHLKAEQARRRGENVPAVPIDYEAAF